MKTFRLIGMALMAVLMCVNFAACSSSDDDEEKVPENFSIVGTWKMVNGDMDQWTIIFREDGTGTDSWTDEGYSDEYEFTYRLDLDNRTLYIQIPGEGTMAWKIVKISNTEVTMQYTYTEEDGSKVTEEFTFRKQN